jgi:tetratricopeptide (TPR) repeat protein
MVIAMTRRLSTALRAAPATVPALATLVLLVAWAADQGGYPVTHWAPGGLIVLALLGLTLVSVPLRLGEIPLAVRIALLCLAGYTALSFLSILWAGSPGDAWEGADRTLLYLIVFALFAAWRQRGSSAALIVCAWVLAIVALALFTLLHIDGANLAHALPAGRLSYPSGYANANAAQWMMAFWPALLLAREQRLAWALRGLLAAGAVILAGVALLSQSRGSLYATPVMLFAVLALLPGRLRTFVLLVPVGGAIAAATPSLLHVGDLLQNGSPARDALHHASALLLAVALGAGLLTALLAALESRRSVAPATRARGRRLLAALMVLVLVGVVGGGLVAAGNPVTRVRHSWQSFKSGYSSNATGDRLVSGLGSNRYDFYRVALNEFVAHPVAGIGADNFAQQYLQHGRSEETPRYPHSVELRTLADTGLIGALLALVGLGAALFASAGAIRRADPLGRAVAAAALAGFGYWVMHGSFDWLWEFAGLGAPAFALLGLTCALAPGRAAKLPAGGGARRGAIVVAVLLALAAAVSLTAPWLSQLQVQSAARIWVGSPSSAYARLNQAAQLNPLSDEAYLIAGSIALRRDELARADHQFALALGRVPADAYATLERGAIASTQGDSHAALRLLRRAVALNPRDPLARAALLAVRHGERLDVNKLNRSILVNAQQFS